jgi:hypothetical protein
MLTGAALDEIQALLRDSGVSRGATVTAHDVVVDRVPLRDAPALARSLYRAATKPWHTEPNRAKLHTIAAPRRNGNLIQLEAPRAVPA